MARPTTADPASSVDPAAPRHGAHDAIVVAHGDADLASLRALVAARPDALLVAADGGALAIVAAGLRPHLVVGDGDSLSAADLERLAADGVELRLVPSAKDESDTELSLLAAVAAGATRIAVLGALGGDRPEHTVANLLLLADPRLDGLEVVVHSGVSRVQRIGGDGERGVLSVHGAPGDFVSLFPVAGPVTGVRTTGMRFPLHAETLTVGPARGLSNELLGTDGRIETESGRLLVVITPRTASDPPTEKRDSP